MQFLMHILYVKTKNEKSKTTLMVNAYEKFQVFFVSFGAQIGGFVLWKMFLLLHFLEDNFVVYHNIHKFGLDNVTDSQ